MAEEKKKKTRSQQIRESKRRIYEYIEIEIRKDGGSGFTRDELKDAAAACGESMNAFIIQAINERLAQLR